MSIMSFFVDAFFQEVLSDTELPICLDVTEKYRKSFPGFCLATVWVAYAYTPRVELLLHAIKYSGERERIDEFNQGIMWLGEQVSSFDMDSILFVPIPSHFLRVLLR